MSLPDLQLIERRGQRCRLTGDEVRYLSQHHRGVLDLAPTPRRGVWHVRPGGVIGVLHTPRRRIIISPKIAQANLLFLLDPKSRVSEDAASQVAPAGDALVRLLVGRFTAVLRERAAEGLHRDYREQSHQGPLLQGTLDVAAQLRQAAGRRDQLHGRVDAFTVDIPVNQIACTVARRLLHSPAVDRDSRTALEQALAVLTDVSEVALTPEFLARLDRQRAPDGYRPLLDLCRLLSSVAGSDGGALPTLLVSLEHLFERYLSRTIEEAVAGRPGLVVRAQTTYPAGEGSLALRPDVTVEEAGQPFLVVDAKWKRLPDGGHLPEDIYQALAYAAFLGAKRAVLVYPGRRQIRQSFTPPGLKVRVEVRTLDVAGTLVRCRRARKRLQRDLLR